MAPEDHPEHRPENPLGILEKQPEKLFGAQDKNWLRLSTLTKVTPFFLSALLFSSGLFAFFALLPLLVFYFSTKRSTIWFAILVNAVLVFLLSGIGSGTIYVIAVGIPAVVMPEILLRKTTVEKTIVLVFLVIGLSGVAITMGYSHFFHAQPIVELKQQLGSFVDSLKDQVSTQFPHGHMPNKVELDEWKHNLVQEIPSAIAIFLLLQLTMNLLLLMRINPIIQFVIGAGEPGVMRLREYLGIPPSFTSTWKAPPHLVWPTILSAFALVLAKGVAADVALNFFKFFMAIYGLHGLSILTFFFDAWNIRGLFRMMGFMVALFFMVPLLLSLGFFDLWFDFRSKLRQT